MPTTDLRYICAEPATDCHQHRHDIVGTLPDGTETRMAWPFDSLPPNMGHVCGAAYFHATYKSHQKCADPACLLCLRAREAEEGLRYSVALDDPSRCAAHHNPTPCEPCEGQADAWEAWAEAHPEPVF